jgi:hypothetical protein
MASFYSDKDGGKYLRRKYSTGPKDFYGTPHDPEEFLRSGWRNAEVDELAAKASAALKSHAELVASPQITLTEHIAGAVVNIPAYIAGDPSYMFMPEMTMVAKTTPVVTIVISGCVSAGLSHEAIQRRGVYALALVRACQTLGYSIDLWHEWRTQNTSVRTHIMRPGDALSDSQLIAVTVHRAWARHYPFVAAEFVSPGDRWNGRPVPAQATDYPEGAIITDTAPGTADAMAEMVKDSLVKAGVLKF